MARIAPRAVVAASAFGIASLATSVQQNPLAATAQKVISEFNTLGPYIGTIGIILGGLAIIFGHSEEWSRLGKVIAPCDGLCPR